MTSSPSLSEALHHSSLPLHILLHHVAVLVWTTDRDLRFTSSQGAALGRAGYSGDRLIHTTLFEFYQTDDVDFPPIAAHRRALRGEAASYVSEVWGQWWDCHVEPWRDEQGRIVGVIGVALDITDRRRAEEAEAQYRSIFEATTEGLLIRNLAGVIVEVNPAHCQMNGYTREELIGQHISKVIHPDYHHIADDTVKAVQAGHQYHIEAKSVRKDGTVYPVEARGAAFTYKGEPHILAVVRDITERQQAYQLLEQRVAERTQELSTLLEISRTVASTLELKPLLRLILDQLKRVADYSGASILTIEDQELVYLDYQRPSALGHEGLPTTRYPTARLGPIWNMLQAGQPVIIGDVGGDSPLAGHYRAVVGERLATSLAYMRAWMGAPLLVKERLVGVLTLAHPQPDYYTAHHAELTMAIANHAALAIENARLYEQVQGKAALEERQRLARELHDSVSQALYGIVLGAETARAYLDTQPDQIALPLEYIRSLADAGLAEMKALIFELRPESLATEGLVAALTKHTAALRARYEIDTQTEVGEEPPVPLEVKEALYRIAQEAMHNVVKHAEAGQLTVRLACDNARVTLEVRDNGVGFAMADEFPGHLGLKSMRERAARLGGMLQVESAPGRGTAIRVAIPRQGREVGR